MKARLSLAALALVAGCQSPLFMALQHPGLAPVPNLTRLDYYQVPSPDGSQLAYVDHNSLYVFTLPDGPPKHLADSQDRIPVVAWSADGRSLYFQTTLTPPATEPGLPTPRPAPPYPSDVLNRVDVASGAMTQTSIKPGDNATFIPSPDGRHALMVRGGNVSLVDLQDGSETAMSASSSRSPRWSPDGSHLLYLQDNGARTPDVVVAAIDGTPPKHLGDLGINFGEIAAESSCGQTEDKLAWTADGHVEVVQHQDRESVNVSTYDLDGQALTHRTISLSDGNDRHYCNCYQLAPGGRYALTYRFDANGNMPEGSVELVGIDLANGTFRRAAPIGRSGVWLGSTGRFLYTSDDNSYYVADLSTP